MNAEPLSTPDGVIRSFCCGRCDGLIPYSIGRRAEDSDADHIARHRDAAEMCCRCHWNGCGVPLERGDYVYCKAHRRQWDDRNRWGRFARAWPDIAEAWNLGIDSMDEWRNRDDCECGE